MMKTVVVVRKDVAIPHTADEWELYTATMNCDFAAEKLTETLAHGLGRGRPRATIELDMDKVMTQYSAFGAADSEPIRVLGRTLDRIFGEEE